MSFDQLHNIANVPEPFCEPCGHSRGHADRAVEAVIKRAMSACEGVGSSPVVHFRQTSVMMKLGNSAQRKVPDHFLTRTACSLLAMNGDPTKPEVAAAQAYFTVQTRRMELRDQADAQLAHDERRIELRGRVKESAKKVSQVAKAAGVRNSSQGLFHGARYKGLYNAPLKDVLVRKGLGEHENLLDRAGPLELSANDFQMNLAAEVIAREGIKTERAAILRNEAVGARVREVIADHGSPMLEDVAAEPPIKEIEARVKNQRQIESR